MLAPKLSLDLYTGECMNFHPGQTITFNYDGGTVPGPRIVKVEHVMTDGLEGIDIEAPPHDNYRRYKSDKISLPSLIASSSEEVIPYRDFLASGMTVDEQKAADIFRLLYPDRKGVRHIPNLGGYVVARRTDLPRMDLTIFANGVALEVINDDGNAVGITFTLPAGTKVNVPHRISSKVEMNDLLSFAEKISRLTGEAG